MNPSAAILVVDDSPEIRYTLLTVLKRKGFQVLAAPDATSALRIAEGQAVGLFIVDIHLAAANGIDFCRQLKAHPVWARVPVAMISGSYTEEDLVAAADAGASAFISKPFNTLKLVECIHRIWTQEAVSFFENMLLPQAWSAAVTPSAGGPWLSHGDAAPHP